MSRRPSAILCALLLAALAASAGAAEVTTTVKYVSAEHVYLDAGRAAGLEVGLRGRVVRDGAAIGELEVVFVAERSASCTVSGRVLDIVAGDTVVFEIEGAPPETVVTPAPATRRRTRATAPGTATPRPRAASRRWRGAVAVQWDHGAETDERRLTTDSYRLPFRVRGEGLGAGFAFRARGSLRRIERDGFGAGTPTGEWRNRIHEVALVRDGRDLAWHFAVGRISTRATATAGPFDGLAISRRIAGSVRFGLFGGFAPEWGDLAFGTDDHVLGAHLHFDHRGAAGNLFDLVLAGIGRYRGGEISREYVTMTTSWRGTGGFSLLQGAEVDFNRGWRRDGDARAVVLSSIALTGRYRFGAAASVDLGYDDREPVRTWETRSLPDSLFEDAGRNGWRAGLGLRPFRRLGLRASASLRRDDRGGGNVSSWRVHAHSPGLLGPRTAVFVRVRGFDGPWLSGWAPSGGLSGSFARGPSLRAEGGYYRYTGAIDRSSRDNAWVSLGVDLDLAARTSVAVEYRQDWGDDIEGRRWFVELRQRF